MSKSDEDHSHNPVMHVPQFCKKRHECYRCARLENNRLRDRWREKFVLTSLGKPSELEFMQVTLTLPPNVQKIITDENLFQTNLAELVKLVNKVIEQQFGKDLKVGLVSSPHYWHSKRPLDGWFPHVHATIARTAWNKRLNRFVKLPQWFDVVRFNEDWKIAVRRKYKVNVGKIVVHSHYSTGLRALNHWLAYQFRYPVQDVAKWIERGESPNEDQTKFLPKLLSWKKKARHIFSKGFMSDNVVNRFIAKVNDVKGEFRKLKPMKEWTKELKKKARMCPYHPDVEMIKLSGLVSISELEPDDVIIAHVKKHMLLAEARRFR